MGCFSFSATVWSKMKTPKVNQILTKSSSVFSIPFPFFSIAPFCTHFSGVCLQRMGTKLLGPHSLHSLNVGFPLTCLMTKRYQKFSKNTKNNQRKEEKNWCVFIFVLVTRLSCRNSYIPHFYHVLYHCTVQCSKTGCSAQWNNIN